MHCLSAYICVREITSLDNQIDLKNICNVFYTTEFLSSWALCVPRNRWLIKQDWKFRPCREMYRYLDQLIFYIFFLKSLICLPMWNKIYLRTIVYDEKLHIFCFAQYISSKLKNIYRRIKIISTVTKQVYTSLTTRPCFEVIWTFKYALYIFHRSCWIRTMS